MTVTYFSGYAATFNTPDLSNDVIMAGAFTKTIKKNISKIRLLLEHDPRQQIGVITNFCEDNKGLKIDGMLYDNYIENLKMDGLSIGFRTVKSVVDNSKRILYEVDLLEVSLVRFPMMTSARVKKDY